MPVGLVKNQISCLIHILTLRLLQVIIEFDMGKVISLDFQVGEQDLHLMVGAFHGHDGMLVLDRCDRT